MAIAWLLAGCEKPRTDAGVAPVDTIDLIQRLAQAQVESPEPREKFVALSTITVGGSPREAIFMHPRSRATFPAVRMTLESRLELSYALIEEAWTMPGDGVQFAVYAQVPGRTAVRVFSSYIDPKHDATARRWVDSTVVLGSYAGQEVTLTLETEVGPAGNPECDWAAWGRAELFVGAG